MRNADVLYHLNTSAGLPILACGVSDGFRRPSSSFVSCTCARDAQTLKSYSARTHWCFGSLAVVRHCSKASNGTEHHLLLEGRGEGLGGVRGLLIIVAGECERARVVCVCVSSPVSDSDLQE